MVHEQGFFLGKGEVHARALLLSERLDLRPIQDTQRLTVTPMVVKAGEGGCVVVFRYGVVVLFGLDPLETVALLREVRTHMVHPFEQDEAQTEEVGLTRDGSSADMVADGRIVLADFSLERVQVVADILAKSVILSHYEERIAESFDKIYPLAADLRRGRTHRGSRDLLRYIGETLITQHNMVGRVEVTDKPELLWERPDLERLYARLEDEYEITERHIALERKLGLISQTLQTLLDLLQNRRAMRVEWYIVALIFIAILLTVYQLI